MQHQVADGVLVLGAAHPNLIRREFPQTRLDSAAQLGKLLGRTIQQIGFDGHKVREYSEK
jgi:hypothetical protein